MSAIALVGSLTLLLEDATLERIIMPLVALGQAARTSDAVDRVLGRPPRSLAAYLEETLRDDDSRASR